MSYADGWAALNLQMPRCVPRFEPSAAEYHWELMKAVTGVDANEDSPAELKLRAAQEFLRAWDYGIYFGNLVGWDELPKDKVTWMGHAEYAVEGRDFDNDLVHPFTDVEQVLSFDPWEAFGSRNHAELVRHFEEHYARMTRDFPMAVTTTGIYITLMSGLIRIFGWDMLLQALGTDAQRFGEVANRYASWIQQYYDACADCSAPVIYSHDDMVWTSGPFVRPGWYRQYIFPNLKKLWAPLREAGKQIIFVCDGNYTQFAEDVAACGNTAFWFEIFTDLKYMTERFGQTHAIIGNADCRVLTFGNKAEIRAEVERCMALGKQYPGYFMCTSGHIPPNVPVENALYYNQIYNELRER
jgi:hypothetical protein